MDELRQRLGALRLALCTANSSPATRDFQRPHDLFPDRIRRRLGHRVGETADIRTHCDNDRPARRGAEIDEDASSRSR